MLSIACLCVGESKCQESNKYHTQKRTRRERGEEEEKGFVRKSRLKVKNKPVEVKLVRKFVQRSFGNFDDLQTVSLSLTNFLPDSLSSPRTL
jgi:hypothetical protein